MASIMNIINSPQSPVTNITDDVDILDCLIDDEVSLETYLNTIPVTKARELIDNYPPGSVQTDKLSPELRRIYFKLIK